MYFKSARKKREDILKQVVKKKQNVYNLAYKGFLVDKTINSLPKHQKMLHRATKGLKCYPQLTNYQARRQSMTCDNKNENSSEKKGNIGVMNLILIIVGVSLFLFTVAMILVFCKYGEVPDTLITCVFAALGGECGVMGWIKTNKDRNRDRRQEIEDRRYYENLNASTVNTDET